MDTIRACCFYSRASGKVLLCVVSIVVALFDLCIQYSSAHGIISSALWNEPELYGTTASRDQSSGSEIVGSKSAFRSDKTRNAVERLDEVNVKQRINTVPVSHIHYQSIPHPANSTQALAVTGLVALGVLIFGVLPTVLYCYCYKRSVENRRRRAVVQFEEDRQRERDMEANEGSRAHSTNHDEMVYEDEPIEEDLSAVVCHGVDVVLYSDEEGQHTPHPVHFYETARRFRNRSSLNDSSDGPRDGQLSDAVAVREGDVQAEVERLPGLPIEARVRPRRHLPRGKVVLKSQDAQRIEVRFHQDAHIPEADPPPLSPEERAKLEAERNRVESPIAYGRANYKPPPNSRGNTNGGGSPVLSAMLLNKLASRENSPVAFSIGNPSPALSLQGSFHSVCRFRGDEVIVPRSPRSSAVARPGGAPPKSPYLLPLGGSLDMDGCSLPSGDYGRAASSVGFVSRPHSRAPSRAGGAPQRHHEENLFDSSSDEDRIGLDQEDSDFYDIGIASREHYSSLDQREQGSYRRTGGRGGASTVEAVDGSSMYLLADPYGPPTVYPQRFTSGGHSPTARQRSGASQPPDGMRSPRLPTVVTPGTVSAGNSSSNFPHPIQRVTSASGNPNYNNTNSSNSAHSSLRASIAASSPNQKGKNREFADVPPLDALSTGHSLVHLYGNSAGAVAASSTAAIPNSHRPLSSRSCRSANSVGDSTDPSSSSRGAPLGSISGVGSPSPIIPQAM